MPAQKVTVLADALRPDAFAAALKRIGGAHFHATARFAVGPRGRRARTSVTTTTDVWVDRAGNYRLREENDRDGGREVVLHGRELSVALRYGKMIRRVAEEPEPSRLLEEALGAPFAVFDLVARRGARRAGRAASWSAARARRCSSCSRATARRVGAERRALDGAAQPGAATASIEALSGRVVVDDATGALRALRSRRRSSPRPRASRSRCRGRSRSTRRSPTSPRTPAIERPAAEDLALRQRTVPEQRELLRGLGAGRAPPPRAGARGAERRAGREPGRRRPATQAEAGRDGRRHERRRPRAARAGAAVAGRGARARRRRRAPGREPAADRAARAAGDGRRRRHPDPGAGRLLRRARAGRDAHQARRAAAGRPRAGSAELLGDPREGTAVRNATLTAATLLALKLAWRKFFALLAVGRRAEEMATTFQLGMLFDHYCAKLHVGAADRSRAGGGAARRRSSRALAESERQALVTAFRDGRPRARALGARGADLAERAHRALRGRALGRERRPEHRSRRGRPRRATRPRRRAGSTARRPRSRRGSGGWGRATWPAWCRRSSGAGERPRRAKPRPGRAAAAPGLTVLQAGQRRPSEVACRDALC